MITIRQFLNGHADDLRTTFAAVVDDFVESAALHADGPEAFLAEPNAFALGASVDGTPAGIAWGLQMRSPSGRLTTYLHQLDVVEAHRRRGVATALVTEAMALARRTGSTRFWLSTGTHNQGAQALYASLGGDRKELGDVNYWWQLT